jgi:Ca2+-binding RTX toxin-like protein
LAAYSLAAVANVENITYTGAGTFAGTGNALANVIIGGALADTLTGGDGNDTLDGGAANDTMVGGTGDDTFIVRETGDTITEAAAGGTADQALVHAATYTLANNVENMTFVGTGGFTGTGNGGANVITGGIANDSLSGGGGNDVLIAGAGNNSLSGGGGNDTVSYASATGGVNASLVAGVGATANGFGGSDTFDATIENLTGGDFADNLTGNGGANTLTGGAGGDTLLGGGGADGLFGGLGSDILNGGTGNDFIDAGDDNDTISQLSTEGRDFVDGGAGATDTFRLNGIAGTTETFTIYTRAAALAAIPALPGIATLNANTEIVITRTVGTTVTIISELDNIEEIEVNTLQTTVNDGNGVVNGGANGGDNIVVVGDFTQTSLNYSTITIDGTPGNDTVDITGLESAHRIVFREQGGVDTVVGALRPQDVVIEAGGNVVGGAATDVVPEFVLAEQPVAIAAPALPSSPAASIPVAPAAAAAPPVKLVGGAGDDRLSGTSAAETLSGGKGRDVFVFGNGDRAADFKAGKDMVDLSGLGVTEANFASMVSVSKQGKDIILTVGDQTMVLSGVKMAKLMKHDSFIFAEESTVASAASVAKSTVGARELVVDDHDLGFGSNADFLVGVGNAGLGVSLGFSGLDGLGDRIAASLAGSIKAPLDQDFLEMLAPLQSTGGTGLTGPAANNSLGGSIETALPIHFLDEDHDGTPDFLEHLSSGHFLS